MSARFSATGQQYTRALSLGASTVGTICCWMRLTTDRNACQSPWELRSATVEYVLQTDTDGTTLKVWTQTAYPAGPSRALTVGTWYFVGVTWSTTTGTMYSRSISDTSMTAQNWTGGTTGPDWTTLWLGSDASNEWLNGNVAAVKGWRAQLSAAEVQAEMWQYQPGRLANLDFWYPLLTPETVDYSGNARSLSGGSGVVVEDGPGIPWRQGNRAKRRYTGIFVPEPNPGEPEAFPFTTTSPLGGFGGWL